MENNCVKGFICFSRQKYYETVKCTQPDIIDDISIGNYDVDGEGVEYEFMVVWRTLGGESAPQLTIFNDAFKCLTEHRPLMDEIAKLHQKDFT